MTLTRRQPGAVQKASFTDIYNNQDPRAYLTTLAPLEYTIPQQLQPLFQRLHQLASQGTANSAILDVCCSYGINGGLLRHNVDMDAWTAHYAGSELSAEQQISTDKEFFASRVRSDMPVLFGLDKAENAIKYALDTGLIDNGWAEDLEAHDPSPSLLEALKDVTLIICTGGASYVGSRTFGRIMSAIPRSTNIWMASTVIRTVSYEEVAMTLKAHGLETMKLPGVLRQRRFTSDKEKRDAIAQLKARGLDPAGFEDEGYLCAEVYISRPMGELSRMPIEELADTMKGFVIA
ncbi:uncharacterized protein B0J16DRAFT_390306 [Fusarium flagelliforme]|uniref:Methyltransferase type 12 n=1 Tax=Fusarium flagelliforme TaxID=2675880 RepID=A0A395N172_9HYPO|nr:uncharacterized protein B0J16DRAFT_390306 [Fusarium flagelliforme]KAH7196406.1 hypothetical protein B0J16DRAFT_390306 [Fusarium flagelliforme]RFN53881.1 methyltransferase type 12 [Fusarium flagelliforme]